MAKNYSNANNSNRNSNAKTALPTGTARIRTRMLPETAIPVQKCLTVKTAAEIRMRTTSQTVTEKGGRR